MVRVFNQKYELGLINCERPLASFTGHKPRILLILVDLGPEYPGLQDELARIQPSAHAQISVAYIDIKAKPDCGLTDRVVAALKRPNPQRICSGSQGR